MTIVPSRQLRGQVPLLSKYIHLLYQLLRAKGPLTYTICQVDFTNGSLLNGLTFMVILSFVITCRVLIVER